MENDFFKNANDFFENFSVTKERTGQEESSNSSQDIQCGDKIKRYGDGIKKKPKSKEEVVKEIKDNMKLVKINEETGIIEEDVVKEIKDNISSSNLALVKVNGEKESSDRQEKQFLFKGTVIKSEPCPFIYRVSKDKKIKHVFSEIAKILKPPEKKHKATEDSVEITLKYKEKEEKTIFLYPFDEENTIGKAVNFLVNFNKRYDEKNLYLIIKVR